MSSEGSVTSTASRIRQFGLYRTIDARTDEFLRSSRRRQIRQGCACAAISTAITVTVVVSVILVYEYSINSESNVNKKITIKPNWLGLMNESDPTQPDLKFEKKMNFDRSTLKLLPILIKALNKNRYLEKIIEDYSSSSPSYDGGNVTENYFQRNIFSNSKNWLKMPSSKGYTIDYKTSPPLYTRRPTIYSDYLSRIRKNRNYKKKFNDFDKIINERVVYSKPSQKLNFPLGLTEKSMTSVTHRIKNNKTTSVKMSTKKKFDNIKRKSLVHESLSNKRKNITKVPVPSSTPENKPTETNKGFCKCPKDMGLLLHSLIQSIKEIIPRVSNKNQTSCSSKKKLKIQKTKSTNIITFNETTVISTTQQSITKATTLKILIPPTPDVKKDFLYTTTEPVKLLKMATTQIQQGKLNQTEIELGSHLTNISSTSITTTEKITLATTKQLGDKYSIETNDLKVFVNTISPAENILEQIPMYGTYDLNEISMHNNLQDKENVPYVNKVPATTTELILPLKLQSHSDEASMSSERFLDSVAVMPNYRHPVRPLFKNKQYEEYEIVTQSVRNDFEDLDVHSFELVKTKNIISPTAQYERIRFRNSMKKVPINPKNYQPVATTKETGYINMRKMADLINTPKVIMNKDEVLRKSSIIEDASASNITSTFDKETGFLKNIVRIPNSEMLSIVPQQPLTKTESTGLQLPEGDQNNENTNEDEFQDEYNKNTENTENSVRFNKSFFEDEPQQNTIRTDYHDSKSHDKINDSKSMLPSIRPVYLEIRRNNDFKPDDHDDYDVNMGNNIFDLPDI